MAISGGDGSIILSTKVDTTGINKGMTSIKNIVGKVGGIMATAFSVRAIVNFAKQSTELASDLQEVQNVVDTAFGSMSYKIEQFSKTAIDKFGISELSAKKTASTYMAMGRGMGIAEDAASDMAITMTGLTADIASFYNISQERADVILKSVYTGETETLKQLGIVMTDINLQNFALSQGITKNISKMTQQEKTMLRYKFVLQQTALAQGDFAKTSDSWANQTRILSERWNECKKTFGQVFVAVGTLLLPAVNALITLMTKLANITTVAAQNIYRMFTGKELDIGDASTKAADGMSDLGKETEKTSKKVKKSLAGFDELQIISSNIAENGEDAGDSLNDLGNAANVGTVPGDENGYMKEADKISAALTYIMGVVGVSLIAVGLLLLFNGNIPWGIGFIIAGAAVVGVSAAALMSGDVSQNAANALSTLMGVIGGALIAVGVILCYLQSWAWGVGFIIAGAAVLGVGMATISEFGANDVEQTIMSIQGIAAGALLAIGLMLLTFTGASPVSIGLIAAGAVLLLASAAQIVAGEAEEKTANMIHGIVAIASGAMLALGIILLFTPASWGLAVGLIVAGAAGLASEAALNWDKIIETLKGKVGAIVAIASGALLALGIILLFTPLSWGLAIGLIVAGAAGLAAVAAVNWDKIKDKIKTVMTEIFDWLKISAVLVLGVMLCASGIGFPIGLALILAGAGQIIEKADLNWDAIKNKVAEVFDNILNWVKEWGLLVLGIMLVVSGVGVALGIALMIAGGANLAEAQDPTWEFIQDKIKEVWDNIKKFWNENIAVIFTKEWWLKLAKECGNGLISGFESAVNGIIKMFEEMLNWIIDGLNNIEFDVPEWVPLIGGNSFGFDIPEVVFKKIQIPRLARGTVVPPNKEFAAVLGDNTQEPEVVSPISTMKQAFNEALQESSFNNTPRNNNVKIVLEMNGYELAKGIMPYMNNESKRLGTSLVF